MLNRIVSALCGVFVPLLLCGAGIFFSFKLKFFHILHPLKFLRELAKGGASGRRALMLSLAGTLGVGNIVGVASAICLGGFGAVLWIWVSALLSMVLKYAEITLALRHRRESGGGAVYYIYDFLHSHGFRRAATVISKIFSLAFLVCALCMGSMLQVSAAAEALRTVFGVREIFAGLAFALLTFLVIKSGKEGVLRATNLLVPIMSGGFVIMSLAVILPQAGQLPRVLSLIFRNALGAKSAAAGIGGFAFMQAVRFGIMRGLVSNESGCGTSPTAHAEAVGTSPQRQGYLGIFEVFFDTVVLCTLTAFVLILEYDAALLEADNYMAMCIAAYSAHLGNFAALFLAISVVLFAFATILCWSHYGQSAGVYLFGTARFGTVFVPLYSLSVLLGACISPDTCWLLSDLSMGVMTVINLWALLGLSKEVKIK